MGHEELLTADVEARVLAEADRWLRAGLSTEPCDRPRAEASVAAVYRAHGLPVPRTVVWMDSPLGGAPASWALRHGREDRLDGTLFTDLAAGPPLRLAEFARRAEERMRGQLPAAGAGRLPAGRARRPLTGTFWDTSEARTRLVRALGEPLYDTLGLHWERGESGAYELEEEMSRVLSRSTDPRRGASAGWCGAAFRTGSAVRCRSTSFGPSVSWTSSPRHRRRAGRRSTSDLGQCLSFSAG